MQNQEIQSNQPGSQFCHRSNHLLINIMSQLAWLKDYKIPKKRKMKSVIVKAPNNKNKFKPRTSRKPTSRHSEAERTTSMPDKAKASVSSSGTQTDDTEEVKNDPLPTVDIRTIEVTKQSKKKQRPKCFRCGERSHLRSNCTSPNKKQKQRLKQKQLQEQDHTSGV